MTMAFVDPRDRDTLLYRECDVCLQSACEKHSAEVEGRISCDRCRREANRSTDNSPRRLLRRIESRTSRFNCLENSGQSPPGSW